MDIVYDIKNIQDAAKQAWQEGRQHKVWVFDAAMGAGKTTFINALCQILKVTGTPSSPTFAIINEYESPIAGPIYHMDWYRLRDEEEAIQAGVEDCLYSGNLCLVEWPGKAPGLLPADTLYVTIELVDENTRRILIGQ